MFSIAHCILAQYGHEPDTTSASDRGSWSNWEQNDYTTRNKHPEAVFKGGGASGAKGKGGKGSKGGSLGVGRGKGKGKGKEKGKGKGGVGVGARSDGGRQLDLASSFKAGAQRAYSDSARQGNDHVFLTMIGGDVGGFRCRICHCA